MNLREAIEQLEKTISEVRQAVSADDKTSLRNAVALDDEATLIDSGKSAYDVVIFGDLNRLKGLNDIYGHDAGNLAIHQAGEKIREVVVEQLRGGAFRQSGDEFVILLKQASLESFLAEVPSFAEILFSHKKIPLKTAMSFGYAINDGKTSFSDLLRHAEEACQYAKNQGDGFCVGWSEETQQNPLVNLRERCQKCGAKISCNVPKQNAPVKLKTCPCCGESL